MPSACVSESSAVTPPYNPGFLRRHASRLSCTSHTLCILCSRKCGYSIVVHSIEVLYDPQGRTSSTSLSLTLSVSPPSKRRCPPRRIEILTRREKVKVLVLTIFVKELRRYSDIQSWVCLRVPVDAAIGILAEVRCRYEIVPCYAREAQTLPHLCL
jgi:hypothetical protein